MKLRAGSFFARPDRADACGQLPAVHGLGVERKAGEGKGRIELHGVTSLEELQEHIDAFISAYNKTATPFAWTKKRVYQRRFKNRRITQL